MEQVHIPIINKNIPERSMQNFWKRKWVIAGIILLLIIPFFLLLQSAKNHTTSSLFPKSSVTPTISVQLQQVIEEAQSADNEYGAWQANNKTNYPWLKKLPLATEKYFVYFDLDKKVFIGKLYLKPNDNQEQIKESIVNQLTNKDIPLRNYVIQWEVSPQ